MTVTQTPAPAQSEPSARPRTWRREIITGGQCIETCPEWCDFDHARDVRSNLDDLTHYGAEVAADMAVVGFRAGSPELEEVSALRVQIRVDPYSTNPRRNVPFATFEVLEDEVMDELGPEELAAVIAQIRAHCDRLDGVLAQLVQARAEYGVQA